MAKCVNCNIEILDPAQTCPLCRSVLVQDCELENMYPDVRVMQRKLLLLTRIYLYIALLLEATLLGMDLLFDGDIAWSAITGPILLCTYMILRYAVIGKADYRYKVFLVALLAVLTAVAVDFFSGYRGWSLDYVLPSAIVIMDGIIIGCMIWNRRNWQSYIMWQLLMVLCSLIPAGLFLAGLERNEYLSFFPLAASAALFAGTMIIGERRAWTELRRRFHIN